MASAARSHAEYRKLDHEECVDLHRDLAAYVEENVAVGPLHTLSVATFGNSPVEQGYMSVPLLNMSAGNITSISDTLKAWRAGTFIDSERDPTTQVWRHIINVPILVKRRAPRSYDGGDIPFNSRRAPSMARYRKPSPEWAMGYLMLLVICVLVLFFMEITGRAPLFLTSWRN